MLKKILPFFIFFAFPLLGFSVSENLECKNSNPTPAFLAGASPYCIFYNGGIAAGLDTVLLCDGDSVQLYVAPNNGVIWSTGETIDSIYVDLTGIYVVTVTDGVGTTHVDSIFVAVVVTQAASITINCSGCFTLIGGTYYISPGHPGSITISALPDFHNYLWSNGSTNQTITASLLGNYTVTVTDSSGCDTTGGGGSGNGNVASISMLCGINYICYTGPCISITGPNTICSGTNITLSHGWWNGGNWYSQGVYLGSSNSITISSGGTFTYYYTSGILGPCPATYWGQTIVTQLSAPSVNITGDSVLCPGQNGTLDAGAGYTSYYWSNGASTQAINIVNPGNYIVTVSNGTCTGIDTITVSTISASSVISGPDTICSGDVANLDLLGAYSSLMWSDGSTNNSITVNNPGSYTVGITYANGCTSSLSHNVTVLNNPTSVLQGNQTYCANSVIIDGGSGFSTYLWSNGASTQLISPSVSGVYSVTVSDSFGCTSSSSAVVTINQNPTPSINVPPNFCTGNTVLLDAGAGYATYQWSGGSTNQTLPISTGGSYFVAVTDFNGCTGTNLVFVTPYIGTAISIVGTDSICMGSTTSLTVNPTNLNYVWSNGGTNGIIQINNAGIYTVQATSSNGCTSTSSHALTIVNNPQPSLGANNSFCNSGLNSIDAGAGFTSYLWSNSLTTQTIGVIQSGYYTVTVTNSFGCTGTSSSNVTIHPLPNPIVSGDSSVCIGDSTLIDVGAGFVSYQWSNGSTNQNIFIPAGAYTITVTDINNCTGSASFTVTANIPLPATISGNSILCQGDTAVLTASYGYASYLWSNGSTQTSISTNIAGTYSVTVTDTNSCITSTSSSIVVNPLPAPGITGSAIVCDGSVEILDAGAGYTNYLWADGSTNQTIGTANSLTTTVAVTDVNGCVGISPPFSISLSTPVATITPDGPTHFCDNQNVSLTANNGLSYLWSDGTSLNILQTSTTGNYSVTVTNQDACSAISDPISITVEETPVVSFINLPQQNCIDLKVPFENTSSYSMGSTIAWDFGDGSTSVEMFPVHEYQTPGAYNVSLIITSAFGCVDSSEILVNVDYVPEPEAKFEVVNDWANVLNGKIEFKNQSFYATNYFWNFGDGRTSTDPDPVHYYAKEGNYTVVLTAENDVNCIDEYSSEVMISPIYIPNTFSPNGDGLNDYFFVVDYKLDVVSYTMKIFNRFGDLIFENNSLREFWNGHNQDGKIAPEGVYIYVIEVSTHSGVKHQFEGYVNLIR